MNSWNVVLQCSFRVACIITLVTQERWTLVKEFCVCSVQLFSFVLLQMSDKISFGLDDNLTQWTFDLSSMIFSHVHFKRSQRDKLFCTHYANSHWMIASTFYCHILLKYVWCCRLNMPNAMQCNGNLLKWTMDNLQLTNVDLWPPPVCTWRKQA